MKPLGLLGLVVLLGIAPVRAETAPWTEPLSGMQFVSIAKACFKMGAETAQLPQPDLFWERIGYTKSASEDEVPLHEVCLDAYWLGKHEVTREQWMRVMGAPPPAETGDTLPQGNVSWQQAIAFAIRLTEKSASGVRFRLPTEAEWEHACRGGSPGDIVPFEDGAQGQAWYRHEKDTPQPVGGLQANAFGLYDMLGNVWEWVGDDYHVQAYRQHALYNPQVRLDANPSGSVEKVLRGGSIRTENVQVRCAMRGHENPTVAAPAYGFRLVMEKPAK